MHSQNSKLYSRKFFENKSHLSFQGAVLADTVEKELARYYAKANGADSLLIDFLHAEFIEIAALMICIATFVDRKEKGLGTYLGYPGLKSIRDFLDVWRFPNAFEQSVNGKFADFLLSEDHHYLREPQITYSGVGGALNALEYNADWKEGDISKRNFFEFITFLSKNTEEPITLKDHSFIPREESKRWAAPLIKQVLKKHLGKDSPRTDIARVVIYEAMSNAIRHPKATTIQVASKFDAKRKELDSQIQNDNQTEGKDQDLKLEGSLRICIWDNGDNIANTLLSVVDQGGSVKSKSLPDYMYDKVYLKLKKINDDFTGKLVDEFVVDQSENLTKDSANEARALLLSLFPGITRMAEEPDTDREDKTESNMLSEQDNDSGSGPVNLFSGTRGMGLYALTRTALDQFQGSLFIRSGNFRLHKEIAHDAYRVQYNARYKCTISKYPNYYPRFKGNLIVIQLPIKS